MAICDWPKVFEPQWTERPELEHRRCAVPTVQCLALFTCFNNCSSATIQSVKCSSIEDSPCIHQCKQTWYPPAPAYLSNLNGPLDRAHRPALGQDDPEQDIDGNPGQEPRERGDDCPDHPDDIRVYLKVFPDAAAYPGDPPVVS